MRCAIIRLQSRVICVFDLNMFYISWAVVFIGIQFMNDDCWLCFKSQIEVIGRCAPSGTKLALDDSSPARLPREVRTQDSEVLALPVVSHITCEKLLIAEAIKLNLVEAKCLLISKWLGEEEMS